MFWHSLQLGQRAVSIQASSFGAAAASAAAAGVSAVVFDRGAYLYHGRVRALADAAREGGLDF